MGTSDKRIDAYIAGKADFAKPILRHVRAIVHGACTEIDEDIKWGMPWFCYKGKLVAYMSAFKAHAAFGFYRGALVMGQHKVNSGTMGGFGRLTGVSDLPSKAVIARYVRKAVALAGDSRTGKAPPRKRKPVPRVPPALAKPLRADAALKARWDALAPSHRREYLEWIMGAKQPSTRERRLARTIAQVREAKAPNWKYEAKRR